MFSDNDRISWMQMERQFSLAYLGAAALFLPGSLWGRDGVFSVLLGTGILFVWIFFLLRQVHVYKCPEKYWGKWPARVVALICQAYLILTGGWLISGITRLMSEYLIPGVPRWVLAAILVVTVMAGSKDIQSRGRFAQAAWPVTAGILGLLLLLAAFQADPALMMEENRIRQLEIWESAGHIAEGTLAYVAMFAGVGLLPFSLAQTADGGGHRRSVFRTVGRMGLWTAVFLLLELAVFGPLGQAGQPFPMLDLMAGARLPGGFLRRMDLIFLTAAVLSLMFALGSIFFYSKYIFQKVRLPASRLPAALLSFVLGTAAFGGWEIGTEYGPLVTFVFLPLLAAVGVCSGFLRRRRIE